MFISEQAGELVLEDTAAVLLPEASAQLCINCFEVTLTMVMSLIVLLMIMVTSDQDGVNQIVTRYTGCPVCNLNIL